MGKPDRSRPGPTVSGVGGVEIVTWDLGGRGPPLLLVHGTGFHGRVWLPLAEVLGSRFHVWALDQRGHGASGHAPGGSYRDWAPFAQDLILAADAITQAQTSSLPPAATPAEITGSVYAAGHSLGAAVLLLAEQARPGTFASMYCYEPIMFSPGNSDLPEGANPMSELARRRRPWFPSRQDAMDNYRSKPPFSKFRPDVLDAYVRYGFKEDQDGAIRLLCPPEEEATVYEGAVLHRAYQHLEKVTCPVTVAGSTAGDISARSLRAIARDLPAGRVELYEDLSHFGPMEDPDRVARAIIASLVPK